MHISSDIMRQHCVRLQKKPHGIGPELRTNRQTLGHAHTPVCDPQPHAATREQGPPLQARDDPVVRRRLAVVLGPSDNPPVPVVPPLLLDVSAFGSPEFPMIATLVTFCGMMS
jgi:hypothetical protein